LEASDAHLADPESDITTIRANVNSILGTFFGTGGYGNVAFREAKDDIDTARGQRGHQPEA
jgi:hypothetical protein